LTSILFSVENGLGGRDLLRQDEKGQRMSTNNPILFEKLPSGVKQDLDLLYRGHGDYTPSMAIRHWTEIPGNYGGSKSQWTVDGYAMSRQYAGMIAEALFKVDGKVREVWLLRDGLHHPGPEILDFCHGDFGYSFPKNLPTPPEKNPDIEEMAAFSVLWVAAYYGIDETNKQYIKVEETAIKPLEDHLATCKLTFSQTGEQVKLLWRRGRAPFIISLSYPGQWEF